MRASLQLATSWGDPRANSLDICCTSGLSLCRERVVIRWIAQVGVVVCTALILLFGSRTYAADPWDACCELVIVVNDSSGAPARKTILEWQRETLFTGTGHPGEPVETGRGSFISWKRRQITAGLADFLQRNPARQARDYFQSLGMTCAPRDGTRNVTRCAIELPVEFECRIFRNIPEGLVPLPEQLRGKFAAFLRVKIDASSAEFQATLPMPSTPLPVSIDASTKIFISTYSQVIPSPGGRLCHR